MSANRVTQGESTEILQIDFTDGEINDVQFRWLQRFDDERGWLAELFRNDELPHTQHPAMAYVSETKSGVARGPHEHVEQTDVFVFLGPGDFDLYLWDARADSSTFGNKIKRRVGQSAPSSVVIPPGVVHAYKNVSNVPGWVFNAPNQLYAGQGKKGPVDEIRHEDDVDSPFQLD